MSNEQRYVLRTVEERGVRFIRLWFTDILGFLKSFAITPAELETAFDEGMRFDGSAIDGFSRSHETEMLARPDPTTFQILPWRDGDAGVARMFCDIETPEGEPLRPALGAAPQPGAAGSAQFAALATDSGDFAPT